MAHHHSSCAHQLAPPTVHTCPPSDSSAYVASLDSSEFPQYILVIRQRQVCNIGHASSVVMVLLILSTFFLNAALICCATYWLMQARVSGLSSSHFCAPVDHISGFRSPQRPCRQRFVCQKCSVNCFYLGKAELHQRRHLVPPPNHPPAHFLHLTFLFPLPQACHSSSLGIEVAWFCCHRYCHHFPFHSITT